MPKGVAFAASDLVAHEAVEQATLAGASPLQAALTGYFAAAGMHAGVLLGPLTVLLFGFGARRVFDGRLRQPGRGAKRPRGFLPEEAIPSAARVAIPAGPTAAFVALAYDTSSTIAQLTKPGVAIAKKQGALGRAAALDRLGRVGPRGFADPQLRQPLIHQAGVTERGLVTPDDFEELGVLDLACAEHPTPAGTQLSVPWDCPNLPQESIIVVDHRGTAVAIAYQQTMTGVEIPALELLAPSAAQPVMRGVSRVTPGTPLPAPSALQVELDPSGFCVGVSAGSRADEATTEKLHVRRPERR